MNRKRHGKLTGHAPRFTHFASNLRPTLDTVLPCPVRSRSHLAPRQMIFWLGMSHTVRFRWPFPPRDITFRPCLRQSSTGPMSSSRDVTEHPPITLDRLPSPPATHENGNTQPCAVRRPYVTIIVVVIVGDAPLRSPSVS